MSLLSVMIAVTVVLIAIAAAVVGYRQHVFARKVVTAGNASKEVSGPLTGALMNTFATYVHGSCANAAIFNTVHLGRIGDLNLVHSLAAPSAGTLLPMPQEFKQALERCRSTPLLQSGPSATGAQVAASRVYGCFQFQAQAGAKALVTNEAFLRAPLAFIEFSGSLQNFPNAAAITCTQAAATTAAPGNGIAGYYALHWVVPSINGPLYKTKYGVMYGDL